MQEILRTNDPFLISYVRSLLMDAGIESVEVLPRVSLKLIKR